MRTFATFQAVPKSKKLAQGVILSRYGAKDWSSGGGLSGAAAPRGRPQVRTRVIRKKGAAERKKNQERKSKACGTRYKRDLNTQAARGPANFFTNDFFKLEPSLGTISIETSVKNCVENLPQISSL